MLDETAYGLGVVTSLGAAGSSVASAGTTTIPSYGISLAVNVPYGLFVEYQKVQLLKEKEKREM